MQLAAHARSRSLKVGLLPIGSMRRARSGRMGDASLECRRKKTAVPVVRDRNSSNPDIAIFQKAGIGLVPAAAEILVTGDSGFPPARQ